MRRKKANYKTAALVVGRHVLKDPTAADDDQSSVGTREECEGGKGHKGRSRLFYPPMPEHNNFTNMRVFMVDSHFM